MDKENSAKKTQPESHFSLQIEDSGANPKVIFPPRSQFQVLPLQLPLLKSVERGAAEA